MPGIEPGASYMQSMRSTTELHPLLSTVDWLQRLGNAIWQLFLSVFQLISNIEGLATASIAQWQSTSLVN